MSRPLLQSLIIVLGLFLSGATQLPQAVAQDTQINPQPLAINLELIGAKVIEGDGSAVANVQLTLRFDPSDRAVRFAPGTPLTVTFATENRTATGGTCGTSGADYVPASGRVLFTGQVSTQIIIQVCSDELSEGDEQFALRFDPIEPNQATVVSIQPASAQGQIFSISDDEPLPTLGITPAVQVDEPNSGQASAVFTVSLTGPPTQRPVTVEFTTAPGTAAAGNGCPIRNQDADYVTQTGRLSFSRITQQQIAVPVCSDNRLQEPNETFFVHLSRPVNATLPATGGGRVPVTKGTGTIVD